MEKHGQVVSKSVRLTGVFKWYVDKNGAEYPPGVTPILHGLPVVDPAEVAGNIAAMEAGAEDGAEDENYNIKSVGT